MDPFAEDAPDPQLTVVVATKDRRTELLHSLRRLTALPERPPIIVVDNGSTDGSAEAVRQVHDADADGDGKAGRVSVIELGENRGAKGRDAGVEAATTPYVAFADDDSWWAPGALARAVELFEAHPTVAVLMARVLVGHVQKLDPVCAEMADSPLPAGDGLPGPRLLGFVACGAVVRREPFLEVGGFDDVLFHRGEEALLSIRLASAGWDLVYVDELVAHHHPSPGRPHARQRAVAARNDLLTAWMCRPWRVAAGATWDLARAAWHDPVARAALGGAARRLPAALGRRRVAPREIEAQLRLLEDRRVAGTARAGAGRRDAGTTPAAAAPPR